MLVTMHKFINPFDRLLNLFNIAFTRWTHRR